jgi:hypothetical protein
MFQSIAFNLNLIFIFLVCLLNISLIYNSDYLKNRLYQNLFILNFAQA